MCHHYESTTDWARDREREEAEGEDDLPSFATEDGADDVEVLTDGGDEA